MVLKLEQFCCLCACLAVYFESVYCKVKDQVFLITERFQFMKTSLLQMFLLNVKFYVKTCVLESQSSSFLRIIFVRPWFKY